MTLNENEILTHARRAFGDKCEIEEIEPFVGGVRKQTFHLYLRQPASRCLLYVWNKPASYFAEREAAGFEESQSDTQAPIRFRENTEYLLGIGINVPAILHQGELSTGRQFALVEYIDGEDFKAFGASASREVRAPVLEKLAAQIRQLHNVTRDYPGHVSLESATGWEQPVDTSYRRTILELEAAAETERDVAQHQARFQRTLDSLRNQIKPGSTFRLLHGELHQWHVLVRSSDNRVYFIDIEALGFGDVESEMAGLEWFFSEDECKEFHSGDLDSARMEYYKFCLHISYVYAGSRLLLGGHPARELALEILSANMQELLRLVDN